MVRDKATTQRPWTTLKVTGIQYGRLF